MKILVDKWFHVYGIPIHIYSDKSQNFDNELMTDLYAMYRVEQSTTTPYNPHGNTTCERLNQTLIDLLKSLPKEQRNNWPLNLPSLVLTYNAMPQSTTSYQPYELMFGCKAPTICDAWLGWPIIMTTFCKVRVNGPTNSMNSPLQQTGMH